MKIIVLDGKAMNPGDLDWSPLLELGDVNHYPNTLPDLVVERCKEAEVIITNKAIIDKSVIDSSTKLKLILLSATGYNNVDIKAARSKNIVVCNASGYGTASVAQHAFALILELSNKCGEYNKDIKENGWYASGEWMYQINPSVELSGKTLGIIGFGNIGRNVAKIGNAFEMDILVNHPHKINNDTIGVKAVQLDELLSKSDIVSLHCPLTPQNHKFIDASKFAIMKASSYLINTSRGDLINEKDLFTALQDGQIAGAGLDVLSNEPPEKNHPLFKLSNCINTPHRAWATKNARQRLFNIVVNNLKSYLSGKPINVIE